MSDLDKDFKQIICGPGGFSEGELEVLLTQPTNDLNFLEQASQKLSIVSKRVLKSGDTLGVWFDNRATDEQDELQSNKPLTMQDYTGEDFYELPQEMRDRFYDREREVLNELQIVIDRKFLTDSPVSNYLQELLANQSKEGLPNLHFYFEYASGKTLSLVSPYEIPPEIRNFLIDPVIKNPEMKVSTLSFSLPSDRKVLSFKNGVVVQHVDFSIVENGNAEDSSSIVRFWDSNDNLLVSNEFKFTRKKGA